MHQRAGAGRGGFATGAARRRADSFPCPSRRSGLSPPPPPSACAPPPAPLREPSAAQAGAAAAGKAAQPRPGHRASCASLRPRCGHGAALTGPARRERALALPDPTRPAPDPLRPRPRPAAASSFSGPQARAAPRGAHRRREAERGLVTRVSRTRASGGHAGDVWPESRRLPAPHPL